MFTCNSVTFYRFLVFSSACSHPFLPLLGGTLHQVSADIYSQCSNRHMRNVNDWLLVAGCALYLIPFPHRRHVVEFLAQIHKHNSQQFTQVLRETIMWSLASKAVPFSLFYHSLILWNECDLFSVILYLCVFFCSRRFFSGLSFSGHHENWWWHRTPHTLTWMNKVAVKY